MDREIQNIRALQNALNDSDFVNKYEGRLIAAHMGSVIFIQSDDMTEHDFYDTLYELDLNAGDYVVCHVYRKNVAQLEIS